MLWLPILDPVHFNAENAEAQRAAESCLEISSAPLCASAVSAFRLRACVEMWALASGRETPMTWKRYPHLATAAHGIHNRTCQNTL